MFKKALWRFIFSYLIIFIIPLIVGFFAYFKIKDVMLSDLYKYNKTMLTQLKDKMENEIMKPIEALVDWINLSPYYFIFLPDGNEVLDSNDKLLNIRNLCREISSHTYNNPYILDAFIYVHSENSLIGPSYNTTPYIYFNYINKPIDFNYNLWTEFLNGNYQYKYIPQFQWQSNYRTINSIVFAHTLNRWYIEGKYANFFVLVDYSRITNLMKEIISYPKGILWVLDSDNNVVFKVSSDKESNISLPDIDFSIFNNFDFKEIKIKNKKWMTYYVVSSINGWKYVSAVPINNFFYEINQIKMFSILLMLLMSIIGAIFILFFSMQNYRPLNEIKNILQSRVKITDTQQLNEYDLIKNLINVSLSKEEEMHNQMLKFAPVLRNNFFIRLLNGNIDQDSIDQSNLESLNIKFESDKFIVALLEIDDCSNFIRDDTEQEYGLTSFVITNVANELLSNLGFKTYNVILSKTKMVFIINIPDEAQNNIDTSQQAFDTLVEFLQRHFSIFVSVGISSVVEKPNALKEAFDQAQNALSLKFTKSNIKVFNYNLLSSEISDNSTYLTHEIENRLINTVKEGNIEKLMAVLDNIFDISLKSNSPSFAKMIYIHLYGIYYQLVNSLIGNEKPLAKADKVIESIVNEKNAKSIFEKIRADFIELTRNISTNKLKNGNDLITKIIDIIEKDYTNPDMSLTSLAENFDITPQYLSAIFKEKTGKNLSDYILNLRLTKAKELLLSTDFSVNKIAKMIGYTEVSGFTKAFKKLEGVSPNKFREINNI